MTDAAYVEDKKEEERRGRREGGLSQETTVDAEFPRFGGHEFFQDPRKSMKCSLVVRLGAISPWR